MSFVEKLCGPPDDEAFRAFLTAWHGPARTDPDPVPPGLEELPPPLRRAHELLSLWPNATGQNRLLPPDELSTVGSRLVFATENQNVVDWATDPSHDDGPVFLSSREPDGWIEEPSKLSRFLFEFFLFEAGFSGAYGVWCYCGPERARRLLAPLERLPLGPWSWPEPLTYLYAGEGPMLGYATAKDDETFVSVTSPTKQPLAYIDDIDDPADLLDRWGDDQ